MAASATFALKVAVWFRRGRLFMVSPDSLGTACPLSGRNSTYRSVQISETSSLGDAYRRVGLCAARILKGEAPRDLPVMQSTKVEFVINAGAARALGLAVPPRSSRLPMRCSSRG